MSEWFEIVVRGTLGPDDKDMKKMTILNRVVEWMPWGIKVTADPKHAEKIMDLIGLNGESNSVVSPGMKQEDNDDGDSGGDDKLEGRDISVFRGLAATLNYLSPDRFDIQYAAKELCRDMANPTKKSLEKVKRAARYLVGCPTLDIEYRNQYPPRALAVYADSDWAGCGRTRKSTS